MKIRIKEGGEDEVLEVSSIERGTFRTTETHRTKVTHEEGDEYAVIHGIQPGDSDLLRGHDFVWLSGSMAPRAEAGRFPLVYVPEGHGVSIEIVDRNL